MHHRFAAARLQFHESFRSVVEFLHSLARELASSNGAGCADLSAKLFTLNAVNGLIFIFIGLAHHHRQTGLIVRSGEQHAALALISNRDAGHGDINCTGLQRRDQTVKRHIV